MTLLQGFGEVQMRPFVFNGEEYAIFEIELSPSMGFERLSETQLRVARLLARGWTYGRIARAEQKSVSTVGKQAVAIYKKLGVSGRFELTRAFAGNLLRVNGSKLMP